MNQQEFNREAILAASDERLNQWAAEKIMGWWLEEEEPRRWDGGLTVPDMWRNSAGLSECEASEYTPLTDIAQAMALLEHLLETLQIGKAVISNYSEIIPKHAVEIYKRDFHSLAGHKHVSLPRAITIAALLAVAAMEGKDE